MANEILEKEKSSGNIFADLKLPNPEEYLAKTELAIKVNHIIEKLGLTQRQAAEILQIDQPKVSALSCGRLAGFSMERLINFLNRLDRDVEIIIKEKPKRRKAPAYLKVAFA